LVYTSGGNVRSKLEVSDDSPGQYIITHFQGREEYSKRCNVTKDFEREAMSLEIERFGVEADKYFN
jgi:hypothetical protein